MQAYATSERLPLGDHLPTFDRTSAHAAATPGDSDRALIDQILVRLADLVVDRLMARNDTDSADHVSAWLDARGAAEYLGIHRDTLRKLAAQRAIPTHQDGPGCKLYFRRDELDEWRRSARHTVSAAAHLRAVS
jgi:excisionase family DNA binding protein